MSIISDEMPNIIIVCPIRNRDWILPEYLTHLEFLDYPKEKLAFHFIVNDSTDESKYWLEQWKEINEPEYRYVKIEEMNFNYPDDMAAYGNGRDSSSKISITRNEYTYKALAQLRNKILDSAIEDADASYIFSIDSDILVNKNILKRLLSTKKDIIAALICNGGDNYNYFHLGDKERTILPKELVFEVRLTGACYLISRSVFSNPKIRYEALSSGEDQGFCESARREGHKLYVFNDLQNHIMYKTKLSSIVLEEILNGRHMDRV